MGASSNGRLLPCCYYRRLWLFSACAYDPHLQVTMHLTGSVRLIKSGIALATPSKLNPVRDVHVTAKPVIQN